MAVRIEGHLVDQWVTLLRDAIEAYRKNERRIVLDLSGVIFASTEGVQLLRSLEAQGIHCVNWPPFLENL